MNDLATHSDQLRELSLFSGAGGGLLATTHLLKWRTVCYVEWDTYCIQVLKQRIADGYLHDAPIWDDVQTFDGRPWAGCVDIVTAGFPCQPFSAAGKQLAEDDKRNMWPDTIRVIRECQPAAVLLENVPGLISSGYIFAILDDLSQAGYKALPPVRLAASDVGANHRRQRIWIVAYTQQCGDRRQVISRQIDGANPKRSAGRTSRSGDGGGARNVSHAGRSVKRRGKQQEREPDTRDTITARDGTGGNVANAQGTRLSLRIPHAGGNEAAKLGLEQSDWWTAEPALGRVANGVAHRVDRLKAIGNGQVPAVVSTVWRLLTEDIIV